MNVVITGATRGIGRAIAQTFAEGGHSIIACARTVKDLNAMQSLFIARYPGIKVYTKAVDIVSHSSLHEFCQWLTDKQIAVDILVNNAGFFSVGNIHSEAEGMLQKMIEVNLYGAYNLTRLLLPAMMKQGRGHIFNICSVASLKAFDNVGAYGISKFALLGFTKNLREEMKPHGIKVTAVYPGATFTDSWGGTGIDPKRIMQDDDIARMVYAASELSLQAIVEDIVIRPQLGDL